MKQIRFSMLLCFLATAPGCASMENVDHSNLNHPAMDLRSANVLGEPSPSTGLRQVKKAGGGESCTVCAH